MTRWLLPGMVLALAACGATPRHGPALAPGPAPVPAPLSAEGEPAFPNRSSDAPSFAPFPRGLFLPGPRRGMGPSDERPPWLPTLPEQLERYPVPEHWERDSLAALDLAPRR